MVFWRERWRTFETHSISSRSCRKSMFSFIALIWGYSKSKFSLNSDSHARQLWGKVRGDGLSLQAPVINYNTFILSFLKIIHNSSFNIASCLRAPIPFNFRIASILIRFGPHPTLPCDRLVAYCFEQHFWVSSQKLTDSL